MRQMNSKQIVYPSSKKYLYRRKGFFLYFCKLTQTLEID